MSNVEYDILKPTFTRRVFKESNIKISPSFLSQAIDVSCKLEKNAQKPAKGLPGYFTYGWKRASEEIVRANELGINNISLRFVSNPANGADFNDGLSEFEKTLTLIQREIKGQDIKIIVDPFGLALTEDGQWGVQDAHGNFDKEKTYDLLEKIGYILSTKKIHGVVTLGRIPEEVKMTKAGILRGGDSTKIYSFSQNSETSTAYVYLDTVGHNTGQKILPGNIVEMDVWALIDIWHGADVSVIKPMESYHLISSLKNFISDEAARSHFLNSNEVKVVSSQNKFIEDTINEMTKNPILLSEKCERLKLSGYTVSGTTYMLSLLAYEKGPDMARARLEEMWLTALGVMGDRCDCLIDRNASNYLKGNILC
uniref:hypothetical protein n=1 Tax=Scandinavium goeteborgense TaxID=1851514 RepID=UPI0013581DEF|nr:hypothetical protein [Scandinavium goeteborgense]